MTTMNLEGGEFDQRDSICDACGSISDQTENWAGKSFCQSCLQEAQLDGYSIEDLDETHSLTLLQSWRTGLISAVMMTTLVSALIAGLFALLGISWFTQQLWDGKAGLADIPEFVISVVYLFGYLLCYISVVAFPMAFFASVIPIRDRVFVEGDSLVLKRRGRQIEAPLSECYWRITSLGSSGNLLLLTKTPRIQIRIGKLGLVVVGWTDEALLLWGRFLQLHDVHFARSPPLKETIKSVFIWLTVGGLLGASGGMALATGTGDSRWITSWMLTGFLDSAVFPLSRLILSQNNLRKIKERFPVVSFVISLGLLGANFCAFVGVTGFAAGLCVNGLIGWFIGREIHRRIDDELSEVDLSGTDVPDPPRVFEYSQAQQVQ